MRRQALVPTLILVAACACLVAFDEVALCADLGLAYVFAPIGGSAHPYRPTVLSELQAALADTPGQVLLHCRSGTRASFVWAAYLIRHRGWSVDAGLQRGMAIGISQHPLARLLDRDLMLIERPPSGH